MTRLGLANEGGDLASFAVVVPSVVPSWTLVVALVVGLVVGGVAGRVRSGRGSSAAADKALESRHVEPEPEGLAVEAEPLAGGVDDVVAELERRYQGRRADGEPEQPGEGRGGQRG